MRSVSDWDVKDLQALIENSVQESLILDYKESAALKNDNKCRNDLSKDVSAFANSAGGRLIYGIVETNHLPSGIDCGSNPTVISREWIEQVINSQIKPRVSDTLIKPIIGVDGNVRNPG